MSADGVRWFLFNASPDVRDQLACVPAAGVPTTTRHRPIEGVVLTDAEVDHSLGLVLLREAGELPVATTAAVARILEKDSLVFRVARAFADMPLTTLPLGEAVTLRDRNGVPVPLSVEAFPVPAGPPRFASVEEPGHTVGLIVRQRDQPATCAFVPGCGELTGPVTERIAGADVLLFDGTFWTDDELIRLGVSSRTARQMDHLPISGPGGSLDRLAALPCRHRVYTHINNTNPILIEGSPEQSAVLAAGVLIGYDGLSFTVE
jgi:pyrroloquinoline quinone biosynthesis protein B